MQQLIKCLVWDLDNTIWDGTLSEPGEVKLRPGIKDILALIDKRGILQSVASRNDEDDAMRMLKQFDIDQFFLYPQIHWGDKSASIAAIRDSLNIGLDSIAFIDDQPYERYEVSLKLPGVCCLDAAEYLTISGQERFTPAMITEDSARRRLMYLEDIRRSEEEKKSPDSLAFLKSLNMELLITRADTRDLPRAEELTLRTNQLNATGKTYNYDELSRLMDCEGYELILCELTDRFGSYGKIGLVLLSPQEERLHIEMMLFSCRVISRGIGSVMIHYLNARAEQASKRLTASFRHTGRNRIMFMTYKLAGFEETGELVGDYSILEYANGNGSAIPSHIRIIDTTTI